ncbi:MAG: efflux RND transporter permease subunit, partial [Sphingomonadales bacterium]
KTTDANVLATLGEVKRVVEGLNATVLKEKGLHMEKSFDPSVFIQRAINLLTGSLLMGVLLAVGVLWWFLRQMRATLIIALAIPVSLLATIIVLGLAGRSVNAISLAGMAFATGMVLDAAIVVLENVVRHREKGIEIGLAADRGASQVWGALVASTATTVAIFLPVLFLKDVEGQIFADLALTIAIGVSISLVVAVTILPAAANAWLKNLPPTDVHHQRWERVGSFLMGITNSSGKRLAWIAGLLTVSVGLTLALAPKLDYLPRVKRDAVDTFLQFPPGVSMKTLDEEYAQVMAARLKPYLSGEKEPAVLNWYLIAFAQFAQLAVRALDQADAPALQKVIEDEIVNGFPDLFTFTARGDLFGGFTSGSNIQMHLQSQDQTALKEAALLGIQLINERYPGTGARAFPDPSVATPEIRLLPNDRRIAEAGWNRGQLANVVRALGDGLWLGEYFDGEERLDIIFRADSWNTPEELANVPLATPSGQIVRLGALASVVRDVGPVLIQRREGRRAITLGFRPPDGTPLGEVMDYLKGVVEPSVKAVLPADGGVMYGGSADGLERAIGSLGKNFLLALVLLFLIMAALFRSLKDSLLVVISIPAATVGGVALLNIMGLPLDLLTMIGFIILLGLVVNNAILLVVQTRRSEAEGESREEAVKTALQLRLRPIFMSTLTSIFGMLPLMLMPGEGAVIYRGMAAAIVGGMSVSALFTLILLPSLLRLDPMQDLRRLRSRLPGRKTPAAEAESPQRQAAE